MNNMIRRKSPFWSLAGPLLGYLAIQGFVQVAVEFVLEMPYAMKAYAEVMKDVGSGAEPSMELLAKAYMKEMEPALEMLAGHQVEIVAFSALFTLILTGILFRNDRKLEKKCGVEPAEKIKLNGYWMILVFGIAGSIAATCLMAMFQAAFSDSGYAEASQVMYASPFLIQIIGLGVVIPIAEEMMFRGILYKRLRERRPFLYSAVWSALIFALIHGNATQMVYTMLLGVMLSYLYEKYASMRAPVFLHILMNMCAVVFTQMGVFNWLASDPLRMAGATIAGAFICSVMFVLIQRIPVKKPENKTSEDADSNQMF